MHQVLLSILTHHFWNPSHSQYIPESLLFNFSQYNIFINYLESSYNASQPHLLPIPLRFTLSTLKYSHPQKSKTKQNTKSSPVCVVHILLGA